MKKIILAIVLAIACSIGAKAQNLQFKLVNNTNPLVNDWPGYTTLYAICPDNPNHIYRFTYPPAVQATNSGTYNVTGPWDEVNSTTPGADVLATNVTPPCKNLLLIAMDDNCPTNAQSNTIVSSSCGYTIHIISYVASTFPNNEIDVW